MSKQMFTVHMFQEMVLKFVNVEAETPEEALQWCINNTSLTDAHSIDHCDGDVIGALVDFRTIPITRSLE